MEALFLLEVDIVEEILMRVIGTKILFLLIKVAFHRKGGLWHMFGDEDFGKISSRKPVAVACE